MPWGGRFLIDDQWILALYLLAKAKSLWLREDYVLLIEMCAQQGSSTGLLKTKLFELKSFTIVEWSWLLSVTNYKKNVQFNSCNILSELRLNKANGFLVATCKRRMLKWKWPWYGNIFQKRTVVENCSSSRNNLFLWFSQLVAKWTK